MNKTIEFIDTGWTVIDVKEHWMSERGNGCRMQSGYAFDANYQLYRKEFVKKNIHIPLFEKLYCEFGGYLDLVKLYDDHNEFIMGSRPSVDGLVACYGIAIKFWLDPETAAAEEIFMLKLSGWQPQFDFGQRKGACARGYGLNHNLGCVPDKCSSTPKRTKFAPRNTFEYVLNNPYVREEETIPEMPDFVKERLNAKS